MCRREVSCTLTYTIHVIVNCIAIALLQLILLLLYRPDWSRCGEFIEGGPEKWAEISDGCSSDELVDVLLAQLAGVDINELIKREVFQGQV